MQNSPDWAHTAIVITYDENGGRWDHVSAPDANGIWGDGTRVPGIVISPFAKKGFVDHTQHDTLSILKTIEERWNLKPLNQYDAKASDLSADFQATAAPNSARAYLQPDADNMGKNVLVVQGGGSETQIKVTNAGSALHVQTFSGATVTYDKYFDVASISRLEVYAQNQSSKAQVFVSNTIKLPALLFGGAGGTTLIAGGGPTVVVGGAGNDTLVGSAAPSILIGGGGYDTLDANPAGNDILVAGSTTLDDNIPGLKALLAEWAGGDTYAQRVARLSGGATGGANGAYLLDADTVRRGAGSDTLNGQPAGGLNWFFAHQDKPNKDSVFGRKVGEVLTYD